MSESEPSSATFCVRNRDGDLLRAKGITILDSYSLVADVIAIRIRLQFCLENQIPNIIVESDSLTIVNIMNGNFDFRTFQKLPSNGRKIIDMDKHNILEIRIR
uniref:RNase H type-1 domain-containing protein n=1 Tax=Solanum lycopersicum TaxID=4081 RepID=A0A3Q7GLZ0_SOLLC